MFNMFNGGKPDPMSIWIAQTEMDKEERQKKLKTLVHKIRLALEDYQGDTFNITELCKKCGIDRLTAEELEWIREQVEG
jgi:hypothetical protein